MNIPSFDPERNYLVYILDMLEAIDLIEKYCLDMTEVRFSQDMLLQDAVIRRLQIIGEAAGKIPQELRDKSTIVPWKKIVAFRNLIIHDYASISFGEVWRVVKEELPKLKPQLEQVKTDLEKDKA